MIVTVNEIDFCIKNIDYVLTKSYNKRARFTITNHTTYRIVYIRNGEATLKFKNGEYPVSSEQLVLLLPNEDYELCSHGDDRWEFTVIAFQIENNELKMNKIFMSVNLPKYKKMFDEADYYWINKPYGYRIYIRSLLYQLFYELVQSTNEIYRYDDNMENILSFISNNIKRKITVKMLADISGYSPSYFKKWFLNKVGCSPIQYVNSVRIERAKELIKTNMYYIGEIAEECGFDNVYYFSNVFKKHTGVSPSKY